jgi:molecular chaperone DnaK (HSP70)
VSPWDSRYVYEYNGPVFRVMSYGKDNKPGGEEFDADLVVQSNVDE